MSNESTIILNDKKIVISNEFVTVNGVQYNNISNRTSASIVNDNIYVGFYKLTKKGLKLSISAIFNNIF
jgi:hypothetical protein